MKWNLVPLGTVCTVSSSKRIFAKEYRTDGIPFYRGKEVIEKHKGNPVSTELFISKERYEEIRSKYDVPQIGDILLTSVGTLGVSWLVDETDFYFKDGNLTWLRTKNGLLNKFLYLWLNSDDAKHQIDMMCIGSTQKALTIEAINKFLIPLPSLQEQEDICAVIYPIIERIKSNRNINDNLQQQVQALFVAWFVNFIPFGGTAPNDWPYVSFADFLTPRTEKSNDPSLPMYSVTDTGIYPRDEKFKKNLSMSNAKNKVIYNTDLVFGMSREILNWGIMRYDIGGVSSAYNVFSVSDTINSFYLESYIKHNGSYFRDLIKPASREGQGIDKNVLMQKQILLPPFDVLQSYYSLENALTQKIAYNQVENARLAELRDTLLPRLLTGEINVSNIDI